MRLGDLVAAEVVSEHDNMRDLVDIEREHRIPDVVFGFVQRRRAQRHPLHSTAQAFCLCQHKSLECRHQVGTNVVSGSPSGDAMYQRECELIG